MAEGDILLRRGTYFHNCFSNFGYSYTSDGGCVKGQFIGKCHASFMKDFQALFTEKVTITFSVQVKYPVWQFIKPSPTAVVNAMHLGTPKAGPLAFVASCSLSWSTRRSYRVLACVRT